LKIIIVKKTKLRSLQGFIVCRCKQRVSLFATCFSTENARLSEINFHKSFVQVICTGHLYRSFQKDKIIAK